MKTITARDAAQRGAKHDDDGRRVFVPMDKPAPVDAHLAALERIAGQIEQQGKGDPALRALLVELSAQTIAVAELVADLARQQQARPQARPITDLKITARDKDDRIQSVQIIRSTTT